MVVIAYFIQMIVVRFRLVMLLGLMLGCFAGVSHAKEIQGKVVKIESIKFDSINLPGEVRGQAAEKELNDPWYQIEVKFSTDVDAEEVQVKFYVGAVEDAFNPPEKGETRDKYLVLTGEQVYLNVLQGREHYAVMFLDPMSLIRYGGKEGARGIKKNGLYVQVSLKDDSAGKNLDKRDDQEGEWYNEGQQISGVLIGLRDSPFWPSMAKRYNRIKGTIN
jgi:hypothetical protein